MQTPTYEITNTAPVDYEFSGTPTRRTDGPSTNAVDTLQKAELKAAELARLRRVLEMSARLSLRVPEKVKRKDANRKKNASARAARKRNR